MGVSAQSPARQAELVDRLGLPYRLLSDERLELAAALGLPPFAAGGRTLQR
jgi:peroxiredoxin